MSHHLILVDSVPLAARFGPHCANYAATVLFQPIVRDTLESRLFELDLALKRVLFPGPVPEDIATAFGDHHCPLSADSKLEVVAQAKWRVRTSSRVFVLRADERAIAVSFEHVPIVSRVIDFTTESVNHLRFDVPPAVRSTAFMVGVAVRKKLLDRPAALCVNVGAGKWYVPGWKTLDHRGEWYRYSPGFVDYEYDLTSLRPMPFESSTVDAVYCEHVLEHLTSEHCLHVVREIHRSLKPGARFRVVVPDAALIYGRLLAHDETFFEPLKMGRDVDLIEMYLILVGHRGTTVDPVQFERDVEDLTMRELLEKYSSGLTYDYKRAGEHINWFDYLKLRGLLEDAGFTVVEQSAPQQSADTRMRGPRFDTRPTYSLHVEASKR